jgi:nucleotide-binding universal stress UspA family protein
MTAPASVSPQAPATILFATDLSSRCDRASDRALIMARQWAARLVALTVIEPGTTLYPAWAYSADAAEPQPRGDVMQQAERRLRADLTVDDLSFATRVAQGPVTDAILAACDGEGAGLVITGVARNEALSRIVLGSSVDALARRSPVPLLVVHRRARTPYRHVVVATDFSPSSRRALETAAALFPDADFTLFHAFDNPYPAIASVDVAQARSDGRRIAQGEAEAFLRSCALPNAMHARMQLTLDYGDPGALLRARSAMHPSDLVVLGTQRRRGLLGLLIGSVAQRILEQADNDVLVVPA